MWACLVERAPDRGSPGTASSHKQGQGRQRSALEDAGQDDNAGGCRDGDNNRTEVLR